MPSAETIALSHVIDFRKELGISDSDILISLIGRINRTKGQTLLLEAIGYIDKNIVKNTYFLIVGGAPPGQDHFLSTLKDKIQASAFKDKVILKPFTKQTSIIWAATDIVVVPSTGPEAFGLVAVEGMVYGKPVIGAEIGGLSEIIQHEKTGILFEPNNAVQLANALSLLILNRNLSKKYGEDGLVRFNENFTEEKFVEKMELIYENLY